MLISLCSLSFSQLIFADSFLEICFSRSAICVCNHHSPHYIYHCVFHIFHVLMLTLMAVFIKCGNIWFYCSFIKSIMECNCMKPYKFLTLRLLKQCIYAWSIKVYTANKTNNFIICIITINILAWLTYFDQRTDWLVWLTEQRSLYNNSYTMEFEMERVECVDGNGLVVDCSFNAPSFNASHCNNAVLGVSVPHLFKNRAKQL